MEWKINAEKQKWGSACTSGQRPPMAKSTAASLTRSASKMFEGGLLLTTSGRLPNPSSSALTMHRSARPSSCEPSSSSDSKRLMSCLRLEQSSCSSHLQNISTSGNSCMHVLRIAWWEGAGSSGRRLQTRRPVNKTSQIAFTTHACQSRCQVRYGK